MNKTNKNSKSASITRSVPKPATRTVMDERRSRTQNMSLNHSQSRNSRLLTNVTEIKDGSKRLHEKLDQMQRVSKNQCDELHEKLQKIHGKELDRLRVLLKKCNKEKEEKDKIIKKLNKDLEDCKREKEEKDETISRHESIIARYQTFYKKK